MSPTLSTRLPQPSMDRPSFLSQLSFPPLASKSFSCNRSKKSLAKSDHQPAPCASSGSRITSHCASLSFQQLTTVKFCNPFVLTTIQNGGCRGSISFTGFWLAQSASEGSLFSGLFFPSSQRGVQDLDEDVAVEEALAPGVFEVGQGLGRNGFLGGFSRGLQL